MEVFIPDRMDSERGGFIHGTIFVRVIPAHQGGVGGKLCFIKMC